MATETKVKWAFEADFFQACNCDYGCPCEFQAPPTYGHCDGVGAWRISRGHFGDVSLDGLGLGYAAHWPGQLHKGNGTGVIFYDERANAQQRDALMKITSGQAGGMPFEIIAATISKLLEPQFVPFQFTMNGKNSRVRAGNALIIDYEPIKNPVTGEPESIRVEHATGFLFKTAEAVSAKVCQANVGELNYSYPGKCGYISEVKYGN